MGNEPPGSAGRSDALPKAKDTQFGDFSDQVHARRFHCGAPGTGQRQRRVGRPERSGDETGIQVSGKLACDHEDSAHKPRVSVDAGLSTVGLKSRIWISNMKAQRYL
jgi:hypothetical protein